MPNRVAVASARVAMFAVLSGTVLAACSSASTRVALPEIVARYGTQTYVGETGGPFCWQFRTDEPETCVSYYFQPDRLDETVPIVRGDTVAFDISSPSQLLTLTARLVREPGPPILEWTALEHEHRTTLVIDVPAGTYLLYVIGFWEHGGYQRAFKLEIVDESEGALSGAGVSGSVI